MQRSGAKKADRPDCTGCGSALAQSGQFCSVCGLEVKSGSGRAATYAVFGLLALLMVVITAWAAVPGRDPDVVYGPSGPDGGSSPEGTTTMEAIDLRQIADNLFNHVVNASAEGNTSQLREFLPLALVAYEEAEPLDVDGLFHLSTLQRIDDEPAKALASAGKILDTDPTHLLGLGAAAAASRELGRDQEAADYYGSFLEVFEEEVARSLEEYLGHSTFLTSIKADAQEHLESR